MTASFYSGKPRAPGRHELSGRQENLVGPKFADLADFLSRRSGSKPFFQLRQVELLRS